MNISWTWSGASTRRIALALLTLAVLTCLLPAPLLPASAAPTPPPEEDQPPGSSTARTGEVDVTLTDIQPAILVPGEDLVVTGTVANGTSTALAQPELRLRAQQSVPISRSMLERWLDPSSLSATTPLHAERLDESVAPGASASFAITVPAEAVPFAQSYSAWGPRGLELTVHDSTTTRADPPGTRSFLLWWPELEVETMPLAVLAAATPTATERAIAQQTGSGLAEVAGERMAPLVAALDHPDVDLAVDPSLLVDVPAVGDLTVGGGTAAEAGPTEADPAPQPELRATIADFARAPGRAVHALLWADADVAAMAHTGRTDLIDSAAAARDDALAESGLSAGTGLAWPVAQPPDAATLSALAGAGAGSVVLPSSEMAAATSLTYTPSARADILAGGTELAGVLTDEPLSALLTGTLLPITVTGQPAASTLDPLTARQYLLAQTAVVARERPADRRDLLLTVPRDFAGDVELLDAQLDALAQAPWLERVGLSQMLLREAPALERETLPTSIVAEGEVDADELDRVAEVLARTSAFAGVLEDPAALVEPVRTSLLTVLSAAWRELPEVRSELVATAEDAAAARSGLVAARPGSTLNLINNEAHIPVAVTNELPRDAHVIVRLEPRDPRLVADDDVALEVPANQAATAQVPVHAIGSGDVVVDVVLAAPDGTPLDEPTEIQVRVRADWETMGTAVVAGLLVALLVAGLIRTVLRARRRRTRPAADVAT